MAYTNTEVDEYNELMLNKEYGASSIRMYGALDRSIVPTSMAAQYFDEMTKRWDATNLMKHLRLSIGCPIMVTRNLDVNIGLANGVRAQVVELHDDCIVVRKLNGDKQWRIMRQSHTVSFLGRYGLTRVQFLITLAYAFTVHRC